MNDIKLIADKVKNTNFLEELLQEFVVRGLGSLPGRETTIAVVGLLLKHYPDWQNNPPQDYEIARLLRTSPRKIRNIRDEISYRDYTRDEEWCKQRLINILQTAERLPEGKFVSFQIDDGLVRDYAQKLIRENYGVFEQGLNASIIKISPNSFTALVLAVMPKDERQILIEAIPEEVRQEHQDQLQSKPIRFFAEWFSKMADKVDWKIVTKLAIFVLTEELSRALELIKTINNQE